MSEIDAVIFDLGGVAFNYHPDRRLAQFADHIGESVQTIRKRLFDSGYAVACDSGRLQGEGAYREGIRMLGQRMTLERFRDLWVSAFSPNEALLAMAIAVKSRAAVALMSNNSVLVREGLELHHSAAMGVFRPQLFSCDIGIMKPDPRIFDAMTNLLGVDPQRTLFVDDAARHVASAASIGLAVHHFNGTQALEVDLRGLELLA
jgi:HAD superfamily hydrolase (TIGR01509 family)